MTIYVCGVLENQWEWSVERVIVHCDLDVLSARSENIYNGKFTERGYCKVVVYNQVWNIEG